MKLRNRVSSAFRFCSLCTLSQGRITSDPSRARSDRDPDFLRYLDEIGIRPGARVHVVTRGPFDGPLTLSVEGRTQVIGTNSAARVFIR